MPMAPLWLALSAAVHSLQGPPAFALTNWLWLRRARWHGSSPPFPHPFRPSPSVLTGPCRVSECWYKMSDPKTGGTFSILFWLIARKKEKKKTWCHLASIEIWTSQKWVGQITKGNISFSFLCCDFCKKNKSLYNSSTTFWNFWIIAMAHKSKCLLTLI